MSFFGYIGIKNCFIEPRALLRCFRQMVACVVASALAVFLCLPPSIAFAVTNNIDDAAIGLQKTVEETAAEYNRATERLEEVNQQIADNEERIAQLNEQIDTCRELSNTHMVELYKLHRNELGILAVILDSEDLSTFSNRFNYFNRIQESASNSLNDLSRLLQERESAQKVLEDTKVEAESMQERAKRAAALAILQREEAQRIAEEEAQREAQAREQAQDNKTSIDTSTSAPSPKDADWSQDKTAFVNSWAGRLNVYLGGSPLAGCGETFASAAWDAGIDPRYSAAISAVESSKGAQCFRPYNAWGWGKVSWSSWEEAIPAHAYGLARGYGYTVSEAAAKKYCENWQFWYERVSEEMAKI